MNIRILSLFALIFPIVALGQVEISGSRVVKVQPEAASGLDAVYVVENAALATVSFTSDGQEVEWLEYSNLGGGYAREANPERQDNVYSLPAPVPGLGYIINCGSRSVRVWVTDYASAPYDVEAIEPGTDDGQRIQLGLTGEAPQMVYYGINGRSFVIDRGLRLSYTTLAFDSEAFEYVPKAAEVSLTAAEGNLHVPSALCATEFTLHPGHFARDWGLGREVSTRLVEPVAVATETEAEQTQRDADNEQKTDAEALGGSAPCEITFRAAVTDAAVFRRWEIASTPDFIDTYLTFSELEFTYTFTEAGTTYVRFTANNAAGTCEQFGPTYTVAIGESRLECPNFFSPGTSEGVNDEWKVSYKSIIEFDCHIFNRWGKSLAHLTDPSQGWDGRVSGKTVGSGVYFYVIKARGSDGKDYSLSGDINVISSRQNTQTNPAE